MGTLPGGLGLGLLNLDLDHLNLRLQLPDDLLFGFGAVFALAFLLYLLLEILQLLFELGNSGVARNGRGG